MNVNTKVDVKGWPIYYEKFGSGPRPILMIPDALGTGRIDYPAQIEGANALDQKQFTLICVEPPGWARSRPPERRYGSDNYKHDCEILFLLMQQLGYEYFSIIGLGEGAKVALLIAINNNNNVKALVINGISICNKEYAIKHINSLKNIDKWDEEMVENYLKVYKTEEQLQEVWLKYVKFYGYYNQYFPNDICNNQYKLIKCPVLVMHGDQDPLTDAEQASYVCRNISLSKLHRFPTGKHDFHTKNAKKYKELVEPHFLKYMSDFWGPIKLQDNSPF